MNRRHFTFSALLGLFGVKATAQEMQDQSGDTWKFTTTSQWPVCKSPVASIGVDGKGKYVCVNDADPEKGEEYCPLGHAQKPEKGPIYYTNLENVVPQQLWSNFCSVCGIVYVSRKKS